MSVDCWIGIGFLVLSFFLSSLFQTLIGLVGFNYVYSEGERIGVVVKLSSSRGLWRSVEFLRR